MSPQPEDDQLPRETTPERVTVSLIPKAAHELASLQAETKMSRSELMNRAMSLYAFVNKQLAAGGELAIHHPDTEETQIVHLA